MNKGKILIITIILFIILIFSGLMVMVFSNEDGRTERMLGSLQSNQQYNRLV